MRAHIIRIGNSQGVRIPKALLEECGLNGEIEMTVKDGALVITSAAAPRRGWSEAFREMALRGDDSLLDADSLFDGGTSLTTFDEESWEWK